MWSMIMACSSSLDDFVSLSSFPPAAATTVLELSSRMFGSPHGPRFPRAGLRIWSGGCVRKTSLIGAVLSFVLVAAMSVAGAAVPDEAASDAAAGSANAGSTAAPSLSEVVVTAERRQLIGNTSTASEGIV